MVQNNINVKREFTRRVNVGRVQMGAGAPISVQTMLNDDPHDADCLVRRIESCSLAGADIVRLTIPDIKAAQVLSEVKKRTSVPIVSDIHFDYKLALAAIESGTDALRINPGNIGSKENVQILAQAASAKKIPIRIGVNGGSLEKGESLVSSALKHLKLLEDVGFRDVVISVKSSSTVETIEAYRELSSLTDCPLHLGVTEAGTFLRGTVHSSVALGVLLSEGIGDTIRVSLTDEPEKEVKVGLEILRSLKLRTQGISVTSCPTCGRTKVNIVKIANDVEQALNQLFIDSGRRLSAHVAVMGCAVNGPGEAKGADVALCGGNGEFVLYQNGAFVKKIPESSAVDEVVKAVMMLR